MKRHSNGSDDPPHIVGLSQVQWFFTREEVREPESAGVEEREVLLADNVSTLALDTVKQKVRIRAYCIASPPNDGVAHMFPISSCMLS